MEEIDRMPFNIVLRRNETEVAYRIIDERAAIIHLKKDTFNILNVVATRIWELSDDQITFGEIVGKIYQEFDTDWSTLNKDCSAFFQKMLEKGLLETSSPIKGISNQEQSVEAEDDLFDNLREKAIIQQIPLIVHFDLIYGCNLGCVHCYIVNENRPRLRLDEVKSILEQLAEAGALYLTLSGGEVLTREDFFEIAQYARKLRFALRVLTNGTLVDEMMAEKIASLNPEMVAISIYSMNPEVHDKITGVPGSFQKSISAAKILKDRNVRLKISTVIMKENVDDYRAIYELSRQLGAAFQADYRILLRLTETKLL